MRLKKIRVMALLLSMVMVLGVLAACGNGAKGREGCGACRQ